MVGILKMLKYVGQATASYTYMFTKINYKFMNGGEVYD